VWSAVAAAGGDRGACQTRGVGANVSGYLAAQASSRPTGPALVVGATRWTWADLDAAVDAAAAGFASLARAGERVGLVLGNRPEFLLAYFGALRAGLVAVPLNPGFTAPEVAACLGDASVSVVVCDRDTLTAVRGAGLSVPVLVAGRDGGGERRFEDVLAEGRRSPVPGVEGTASDLAVVLYTSGTTGTPRGAMLTHAALRASSEQVAAAREGGAGAPLMRADDTVLLVLPLAHVYSLNGTVGAWVRSGATLVLGDRSDPESVLRLVAEHRVTNLPAAPPLWRAWAASGSLSTLAAGLRVMFSGAAPLPASVMSRVLEQTGRPVYDGYGLTEAAPGVCSTFCSVSPKPGSVGRPFPGVEVSLRDERGDETDAGDPGEIWLRGPNLFSGFWPDGADGPSDDGWYATGDVAYRDDDGDLFLVDRRKELVIVNGFNVYPREVEQALLSHPDVVEAAVVGVPDERSGEAVKAFVVLAPGTVPDAAEVDAVLEHASQRLARFKRPREIEVVATLPHSATGKVAKSRLREQA
jgi:long-chain acyl-CoA synthetase